MRLTFRVDTGLLLGLSLASFGVDKLALSPVGEVEWVERETREVGGEKGEQNGNWAQVQGNTHMMFPIDCFVCFSFFLF